MSKLPHVVDIVATYFFAASIVIGGAALYVRLMSLVLAGGFFVALQPEGIAAVVGVVGDDVFLSSPPRIAKNATTAANSTTKIPTRMAVLRWRCRLIAASRASR